MHFVRYRSPSRIKPCHFRGGRWEPFLGHYLQHVSDRFSTLADFYMSEVDPRVKRFFDDHHKRSSDPTLFFLIGQAGVGKTSFVKAWTRSRDAINAYYNANDLPTTAHAHPATTEIENEVLRHFSTDLRPQISNKRFREELTKRVNDLRDTAFTTDPGFAQGFVNQSTAFQQEYPDFGYHHLLAAMVAACTAVDGGKVWFIFDNSDLQPVAVQEQYFLAAHRLFDAINDVLEDYKWTGMFHVVVPVRRETEASWRAIHPDYQCLTYRNNRILTIFRRRLGQAIRSAMRTYGDELCNLSFGGRNFSRYSEIGAYLLRKVCSYLRREIWPYPVAEIGLDEWHLSLVNEDVRRLLNFWVHFLLSGNFLDLVLPEVEQDKSSVYTYQRAIFRGRYTEFPGNWRYNANSEDSNSPIIVNLFGMSADRPLNHREFGRHYFLNTRMLQYLCSRDRITIRQIRQDMERFFDPEKVDQSLRWLLWTRLADEDQLGVRNIGLCRSSEDIALKDDGLVTVSGTGRYYLEELLGCYEYLCAVAPTTYQLECEHNTPPSQGYLHDDLCAGLAYTLVQVLKADVQRYRQEQGLLELLWDTYVHRSDVHPVHSVLQACLVAVQRKCKFRLHENGTPDEHLAKLERFYYEQSDMLAQIVKECSS